MPLLKSPHKTASELHRKSAIHISSTNYSTLDGRSHVVWTWSILVFDHLLGLVGNGFIHPLESLLSSE